MPLPFSFSRTKPSRYADQQLMADEYRRKRPQLQESVNERLPQGGQRPRRVSDPTGLTNPGNLDPYNRPVLVNGDGTISTTSSTGVGTDKGETIIPTVVDGVRLTPEQAMAEFRRTGGNFGSYGTIEQGDAAATALHNDQADYLARNGIGTKSADTRSRVVSNRTTVPPNRDTIDLGPLSEADQDYAMARYKRGGKPTLDPQILDPLDRQRDYRTQVEGYEPKKASWKEHLPAMILTALAGARGGLPGLIGASGVALANRFVSPKKPNEQWKNRELDQVDERIGGLESERLKESQIAENEAQAEERKRIKPKTRNYRVLTKDEGELKKGTKIATEFNPKTGEWEDVASSVLDLPSEPTAKAPLLRERTNADGSKSTLKSIDNGETWTEIKDLGDAPPKLSPKDVEDVGFENQNVQTSINEMVAERDKLGRDLSAIPKTIPFVNAEGAEVSGRTAANPEFKDYMDRYRQLDDKIREARTKLKAPKVSPKGADPLKGAKWSKSKYRGSKSIEQAAKEAEARGAVIVE